MSSQARDSRAEERRLSVRTLAIASASSAIAAIVTSRLWAAGTPIAAAMTPVLVTLLSEMLHRPTAKIAERFTVETDALPEAMGSGPPPTDVEDEDPQPMREQPLRDESVSVYRSGVRKPTLPWKLIAATAALAFVIGVGVLTLPQLIAGESLLKGNPPGYGSASKKKSKADPAEEDSRQAPTQTEQEPDTTTPERTTTDEEPGSRTAPEATTPAPGEEPPADPPKTAPQTTPLPAPPQGTPLP